MASDQLVLHINKTIASVDKDELEYNSDERGKTVDVHVIDTDNSAYDLTGVTIRFCEQKENGKIIVDQEGDVDPTGKGGTYSDQGGEELKGGHFAYTFTPFVYQASGDAWFEFKKDENHIDISNKFHIKIEKATSLDVNNDNYISSLEAELSSYTNTLNLIKQDKANLETSIQNKLDSFDQSLNTLKSQWQEQTADINTNFNNQLQQEASDFDSTKTDQVKAIQDARDAAIQQANTDFATQRDNLKSEFESWLSDTKTAYANDIADLKSQLKTVSDGIKQVNDTDFPAMDNKVKALKQEVENATANIESIDISKYELKSDLENDYYTKAETDAKVASAGKLKTISVDGGTAISPDANGNANLDLSQYAKSADVSSTYETKADAEQKANQTDVSNNTSRITTLENTVNGMKTTVDGLNSALVVKACTQAQYNAMTDAQKNSGAWMITDS